MNGRITVREKPSIGRIIAFAAVCAAAVGYYLSQVWLYTNQALGGELYYSDLKYYMQWFLDGEAAYEMITHVLNISFRLGGYWGVGIVQTLFALLSFAVSVWIFRCICGEDGRLTEFMLLSLIAQTVFTAYIPGGSFYKDVSITVNNYHSPTYIQMEAFAVVSMGCLYKLLPELNGKPKKSCLALFALSCALGAYAKPSFLFCMSIALLMWLIADFIKTRLTNIKNEVLIGICVLPGVAVCLYLASLMFVEDSAIIFSPLPYGIESLFGLFRSGVFAFAVLICYGKKYLKKDWFAFSGLVALVGVGEFFLLRETGERANDGNMAWSAQIGLFVFTFACIAAFYSERRQYKNARFIVCGAALLWQFLSGAAYYILMLRGVSYWI